VASLSVHRLSKSFGSTRVLEEISFEVADGEFCVLLGPSGCGKTTVLRLIGGLEEATSGSISLGDQRIGHLPPRDRDVAFVFQSYALYPHMNVYENLSFSLRLRGLPKEEIRQRVIEAARLLDIERELERKPQQLSGGQRQRVAVGRAIVRQPKIFLFDEPLSNLDATLRASMRVEMARLHQRLRATVLYVTHDQAEAMTLADKIIVLDRGKNQQIGSPSAIFHEPVNTFVAGFVGSPRMNLIEGRLGSRAAVFQGEGLEIDLSGALGEGWGKYAGKPLTLGIRPEDLQVGDQQGARLQGTVEIVEDLGSDRFAHLRCGKIELVARMPGNVSLKTGETLELNVRAERFHLFYEGKRITR